MLMNADTRPVWARGERALFEHIGGDTRLTGRAVNAPQPRGEPDARLGRHRPPAVPSGSADFSLGVGELAVKSCPARAAPRHQHFAAPSSSFTDVEPCINRISRSS
ncbi:hypothetical protein PCAR4_740024 [Paraburkholderia caribensis]|nr:hypothetical protein PCAR4_740024 [Paraburkholderia caribensis]